MGASYLFVNGKNTRRSIKDLCTHQITLWTVMDRLNESDEWFICFAMLHMNARAEYHRRFSIYYFWE